ncbi:methyltransferase domain-containing protein [Arthrobacter sp. YD4]|uniref:methyltransferase domain-containing protein n=1 Tax=Arthrobacter sp. YD4 TaxID=3058043 RepID=UPI0025B3C508|nr:methyltransferase domain-containing protein [Arthrobacter sp. YD4]MDN3936836.1 methyltransferase domain-containing protein [Arthrobacter sp. YD4]
MLSASRALLACPLCRGGFLPGAADGGGLVCDAGHSFDAAKQGYINLLTGKGTVFESDSADMVAARHDFLSASHYRPLADALAEFAAAALTGAGGGAAGEASTAEGAPEAGPAILDAGTGTGHYLRAVLDRVPAAAVGLDISKFALRRAARLNPGAANLVADIWQPLPVRDAAVDVVMVVFAPRNAAEFARVLRPGGRLIVVTPRPGHLTEVAGTTGMLGIEPAKEERLAAGLAGHFTALPGREVDIALDLTPDDVVKLALMGPAGHHLDRASLQETRARLASRTAVTARFRISVFTPLEREQRPEPRPAGG